ncbi:MAG: hypothetical protein ACLT4C_06190 [Butyricicoccus sp.]
MTTACSAAHREVLLVKYGARNLRRLIERDRNPLATAIVTGDSR